MALVNQVNSALIAGQRRFRELLESRGPLLSLSKVAYLINAAESEIMIAVVSRRILAAQLDGELQFPSAQFGLGLSNVFQICKEFPSGTSDKDVLLFFLSSLDGGAPPIELIHDPEKVPLLLARARSYLIQGEV